MSKDFLLTFAKLLSKEAQIHLNEGVAKMTNDGIYASRMSAFHTLSSLATIALELVRDAE